MSSPPLSNPLAAEIAEFEALLVTLRQLQAENYSQTAAISVLAFDIFLTLGDEAEYIWKAKWSFPKFLYIFARYYGLFHLVFTLAVTTTMGPNLTLYDFPFLHHITFHHYHYSCRFYFWFYSLSGPAMFEFIINIILVMRLHAIYDRSYKILSVLLILLLGELTSSAYFSIQSAILAANGVIPPPPGVPLSGCISTLVRVQYVIVSCITSLAVATTFFALTLWRFWKHLRRFNGRWNQSGHLDFSFFSPLLVAFYRDGTLFFFLMFAATLVFTVTNLAFQGPMEIVAIPWVIAVYAICASRLILNLRAAANSEKPQSSWSDTLMVEPYKSK